MNSLSLCCYVQSNIYDNYISYIDKIILKYLQFFNILSSVKLDSKNSLNEKSSDISILIIRESETNSQLQNSLFMKITNNIRKITNKKILIIVFSELKEDIVNKRIISYEKLIPDSVIKYLDFEDWFPVNTDDFYNRHYKNLYLLDDIINNYLTSIITDLSIY